MGAEDGFSCKANYCTGVIVIEFNIKLLQENAKIPTRATQSSAGYDLYACIEKPVVIMAGKRVQISTGIALEINDENIGGFIFARSGLAINHGISLSNSVGVIDADYRGEIIVGLINQSFQTYTISLGDRIAQLVFLPVYTPILTVVNELDNTQRGTGGFGSTGG